MANETKPIFIPDDQPGPRLGEVAEPAGGRSQPGAPENTWVPGLIEVVFRDATQSGVRGWKFAEEKERKEFSKAWPDGLSSLLNSHELISWRPSFPLGYPWTIESNEEALEKYRASGRDKFVTFNFPAEAETLHITQQLKELPEIDQAVAVPRIGPPSGPFDEPLIGTTDQPTNTVCRPNGCLTSQWYIFRCRIDQAWKEYCVSGRDVTIADIDWGFNRNHQDLAGKIKKTQHVLPNVPSPCEVGHGNKRDHGTAVLGLAGAEVNRTGMAGVAFGADLWAIQAGTEEIENHDLWVAGINFVSTEKSKGRKVIILEIQTKSGGNIEMIPTIGMEIIEAINKNIVVCVPAGNGSGDAGIGDDGCPIPPTGSILVGATKFHKDANIRGVGNGGSRVVVYAPGDVDFDLTCSSTSNDTYQNSFGYTSGATPKVAGVVALMLEANSQLKHAQVRNILLQSPTTVVDDSCNEVGVLLNAKHAVSEALRLAGAPAEKKDSRPDCHAL